MRRRGNDLRKNMKYYECGNIGHLARFCDDTINNTLNYTDSKAVQGEGTGSNKKDKGLGRKRSKKKENVDVEIEYSESDRTLEEEDRKRKWEQVTLTVGELSAKFPQSTKRVGQKN